MEEAKDTLHLRSEELLACQELLLALTVLERCLRRRLHAVHGLLVLLEEPQEECGHNEQLLRITQRLAFTLHAVQVRLIVVLWEPEDALELVERALTQHVATALQSREQLTEAALLLEQHLPADLLEVHSGRHDGPGALREARTRLGAPPVLCHARASVALQTCSVRQLVIAVSREFTPRPPSLQAAPVLEPLVPRSDAIMATTLVVPLGTALRIVVMHARAAETRWRCLQTVEASFQVHCCLLVSSFASDATGNNIVEVNANILIVVRTDFLVSSPDTRQLIGHVQHSRVLGLAAVEAR